MAVVGGSVQLSLLHCPYCHGWEVRDQPLGVLGTIAGSVQHALLVRQWSDDVVFFAHAYDLTDEERAQLDARGIRIEDGTLARLMVENDQLRGVELVDGRVVLRSAVFIRPGNVPHDDRLLAGLGCNLNEAGFATVDATGRTSTPGVCAAGKVVDPRAQVITAAGAGSAAAIVLNADLVQEDVDLALQQVSTAHAARASPPFTTEEVPDASSNAPWRALDGAGADAPDVGAGA